MRAIGSSARRVYGIGAVLLLVTGGIAAHRERAHAQAQASDARFVTAPCDLREVAPSCDAGWRVHIDPETGRYAMPASDASAAAANDAVQPSRELAVEPGTSPAGGYVVRLDGAPGAPQEQR